MTVVRGPDGQGVNMRSQPYQGDNVIARVADGEEVTVLSGERDWCRIRFHGKEGFMMRQYLEGVVEKETGEKPDLTELLIRMNQMEARLDAITSCLESIPKHLKGGESV